MTALGRQINKTDLISLILIDAQKKVRKIIPLMTEEEEILYKGHMMEMEECILHSEVDQRLQ